MCSERPYSVAMMPERAVEELRRGAGTQFDPAVVAGFEQVLARSATAGTRGQAGGAG
jgi:HD-GYP domain-containing protein (c-di-GMP phosphodiesterase class II)